MEVRTIKNAGSFQPLDLKDELTNTGLKAVIAVVRDNVDVTLQGSLDNTTFFNIETFTASSLKEITLVPYFRVNGDATNSAATIGDSTVKIMFERRAFG